MNTLSIHTPAGKLIALAKAANCTPGVMATRLRTLPFSAFKSTLNYCEFRKVRKFAKHANRFHSVLWSLTTGATVTALHLP